MNKPPASRLARLTKVALPAAPIALAALPAAHAQIVYTNPADVTMDYSSGKFIYIDMGTGGSQGTMVLGTPSWQNNNVAPIASPSFYLFFRYNNNNPEWSANNTSIFDGNNLVVANNNDVRDLSYGSLIDGTTTTRGNYAILAGVYNSGTTEWTPGTTGYIGVQFDMSTSPLFGWVHMSYNADKSITVYDFAYNASGGGIAAGAGAVPEPASSAAIAGLLAGTALLFAKRRKKTAPQSV